ncbi:hypothetical protein D3C83_08290 [compost metagenome]
MPVSTSPIPALAMPGLPDVLICQVPSGAAQMLPVPLSTTKLPKVFARASAAATRSFCTSRVLLPSNRAASAGWGVSSVAVLRRFSKSARCRSAAIRFRASASSTSGSDDSSAHPR